MMICQQFHLSIRDECVWVYEMRMEAWKHKLCNKNKMGHTITFCQIVYTFFVDESHYCRATTKFIDTQTNTHMSNNKYLYVKGDRERQAMILNCQSVKIAANGKESQNVQKKISNTWNHISSQLHQFEFYW